MSDEYAEAKAIISCHEEKAGALAELQKKYPMVTLKWPVPVCEWQDLEKVFQDGEDNILAFDYCKNAKGEWVQIFFS